MIKLNKYLPSLLKSFFFIIIYINNYLKTRIISIKYAKYNNNNDNDDDKRREEETKKEKYIYYVCIIIYTEKER